MPRTIAVLLTILVSLPALADPPDSKLNPVTQYIETVSETWNGTDYDIRHTVDRGALPPIVVTLAATNADETSPRIEISESGDVWVAWKRAGNPSRIVVRRFDESESTWKSSRLVGEDDEEADDPSIVFDGTAAWVAYRVADGTGSAIAVAVIADEPDPIGDRTIVATTGATGGIDVRLEAESGQLWLSWIDEGATVGYAAFSGSAWGSPAYESYASDDVEAARARIRQSILEP